MASCSSDICWKGSPPSIELLSHFYQQSMTKKKKTKINQWLYFCGSISGIFILFHCCVYISTYYCSYTVSLNLGWVIPPPDSCQDGFSCSKPMTFFIDFRITFSMYAKKPCWDFDRNYIKSIGQFGENWCFKYVGLSSYNHNMCIHLLRSPWISFNKFCNVQHTDHALCIFKYFCFIWVIISGIGF